VAWQYGSYRQPSILFRSVIDSVEFNQSTFRKTAAAMSY